MYICGCSTQVCIKIWRQEIALGCLPWSFSTLYSEAGSLTWAQRLFIGLVYLVRIHVGHHVYLPGIYMGTEDPNSTTRVCTTSTLPNELFSWCPNVFAFFVIVLSNIGLMVLRHELCRWKQCVAMSKGWTFLPVTAVLWKCITLLLSKLIY